MSLTVLGVMSRAFRLLGIVAAGATPEADDAAAALIAFNAMKRAWFGTLIGPRLSPIALSGTSGQAENGGDYSIPNSGPFTLTAPLNPRSGARFGAVDGTGDFSTNACAVNGNGRFLGTYGGAFAPTATLNTSGISARWWFAGHIGSWVLEVDSPSLSSLIEFPDSVIAYMPYMLCVVLAAEFSADLTPEVEAGALEGRALLARLYGRRGMAGADRPLGLYTPPPAAMGQGG